MRTSWPCLLDENGYRYHEIFNAARLKPDFLAEHVDAFLKQVLTGGDCCPPEFAHFTFRDDTNMFVWPLCYIEAYLDRMGAFGSPLANLIAISDHHPLSRSQEKRKESLSLVYRHEGNIERGRATTQDPIVALAFPKHRKFERFDAIIRCSDPKHPFWRGLQIKLGNGYPEEDCTPEFPGVLVRGDSPEKAAGSRRSRREHWTYLTYLELEASLPYSLWPLIPHIWKADHRTKT